MRGRIHRGAREVGGSCVELEADGWRVVLDVGLPLESAPDRPVELPHIPSLSSSDGKTAVVVSHGHPDHYGLLDRVDPSVPLLMGSAANRLLREAAFFTPALAPRRPTVELQDRVPVRFGPFRLTSYLADHSGFDAYSVLVEAEGKRLFYTGDLRAHGRKASAFERLLSDPPPDIDVLLMEGTHVRADGDDNRVGLSEMDVEARCRELFASTAGPVLVHYSPQNIDRLVSLYRAAKRSGRLFVMDLYAATVAKATGLPTIPTAEWDGVRVYVPRAQRARVKRTAEFSRTAAVRAHRIHEEEIRERANELVLTFRPSMTREVERMTALDDAVCVWSLWAGYLESQAGAELRGWLEERRIPLEVVHASGHASVGDLRRLANTLGGDRVIPIHTSAPERFIDLFERVELRFDGEWWRV